MKKTFYLGMLIMLGFSLMSSTCSNDDDDFSTPNDNSQQIAQVQSTVISGTWFISSYVDSGQNETNDFNGYQFTFGSDGVLTANNGTNTVSGTWSVTDSSNSNDDSSNDIDFNIFFPVPDSSDFEDLNDDWDIVSHTDSSINLIDVSGGNGGTDTLVFQKN